MFFSTALLERRPAFDFVDLYIPSNPFNSLANNIVPAVVLFSVIVGVALIGVERKQRLLDVLQTAGEALTRATRSIVRLTPYGLFAIAATAAGTLSIEQLGRLQVYLHHLRRRGHAAEPLGPARPGGDADAHPGAGDVQPDARRVDHRVCRRRPVHRAAGADRGQPDADRAARAAADEAADLPDVLVPASFNFPHTGKLLSISFIAVCRLVRGCARAGRRTTRNWP